MKRLCVVLLALVIAAGSAGLSRVARSRATPDRVYTVAQVRAGLALNPRAWIGRTVLVRGTVVAMAFACPDAPGFRCTPIQWDELDPDVPGPQPLILVPAPADPVLAVLHRLPLLGPFLPLPPPLRAGPGVYRLHLRAPSTCLFPSSNPSCADALVLNAQP
jgi:hypothetical protein